jgi:hypothetical protein
MGYNNITMTQQPYMGPGLLLPPVYEVTKSCAFVTVGDWSTGRATILSILMCPPEPSGRQSGDLGEKWRQFGLRNIFINARTCTAIVNNFSLAHYNISLTYWPEYK